ncbi:MAG: penicillin-binding protein activator [Deltaproteobacteria bacterium]|nr:penicillin-binding protein activator [Deltaproteobacteria bacterium]
MILSVRQIRFAAVATVLVLIAACAGPTTLPVTEVERRAYHAAKAKIEADPEAAERDLKQFVLSWPESGLAPRAESKLAEIAYDRGDQEAALDRYYGLLRKYPRSEMADSTRIHIAEIELARGNPNGATAVLAKIRTSRLSDENKRLVYRTFASAVADPVAKLRWLARLRPIAAGAEIAAIDAEINGLIYSLDSAALERAIDQIGKDIPASRLQLRRASIALAEGDVDTAEKAWKKAASLPKEAGTQREFELLGERIEIRRSRPGDVLQMPTFAEVMHKQVPSTDGARGTIGVILPLTGSFAHFGNESLKGILLAAGVFDGLPQASERANVKLMVRDTAGRPERAADAVRELARNPDVRAIIGPLLKGEAEAAATAAELEGIPLIALTARSEVAQGRPHVFRVRTRPIQEIQVLADYVVNEVGAQRFAILYPRDAYGVGLRAMFWDAVEARGGTVVGIASYDPDATDFASAIRNLVGYRLLTDEQKEVLKLRRDLRRRANRMPLEVAMLLREEALALTTEDGMPLPPTVDFDALFIPESHEKVVLIAPQLAFHEVVGVQLLGASGWYDKGLLEIGRDHVKGALFTSHYYADSTVPFVQDFTQRYAATFASVPDALTAQAFDAANLVMVQLARGRDSREGIREGVLEFKAYPGVSGVMRMTADGNAQKRPFLLSIERRRMKQVN